MANKMFKYVIVIMIILFFCFVARAQNAKERTLLTTTWENEPVKIIHIESVQGPLRSGKAVARNETWFQELSVRVKNTSDKTIVNLMYVLTIYADGKSGQHPIGTELPYGELDSENSNAAPIPPGGETVISLSEDRLGGLAKIVKARKKTMDDIIKARLILQVVCFDDRTCWVGGNIVPSESFTTTQSQITGQSIQQHSANPHKIKPQMDFCGAVMSQYKVLCCDCSGSSDTYCRQYRLREAKRGETKVFLCPFSCTCSCPQPDDFTRECTGYTLVSCSGYPGICNEF